jgi:hypothetical protein
MNQYEKEMKAYASFNKMLKQAVDCLERFQDASLAFPPALVRLFGGELTDAEVKVNAAILGRRGGVKGGRARAAKLSPERRKEISQKAAQARWKGKPLKAKKASE